MDIPRTLDSFGIDKYIEMLNERYDCGEMPEDLSRSIFIAMPMKPRTNKCELYWIMNLVSYIIKLVIKNSDKYSL